MHEKEKKKNKYKEENTKSISFHTKFITYFKAGWPVLGSVEK